MYLIVAPEYLRLRWIVFVPVCFRGFMYTIPLLYSTHTSRECGMVHSKNWTKYKTEHFQKDNKVSKLYNKQTVTVGRLLEGQHKSVFFKNTARSKKLYSTTLLSAISFCVTVEIVE